MSGNLPKLDNILTEKQQSRLPNEPEAKSTLLKEPKNVEIIDFGDKKTASTIAHGILTPLFEEDVINGQQNITDVDWNRLRSTAQIIHDGPLKSFYVGEEILEEFESRIGVSYIRGVRPQLIELRDADQLYDRLEPLEKSPHIDPDGIFKSIDKTLENNRMLCAYLTDNNGCLTDSRSVSYIEEENPANKYLREVANSLAGAELSKLTNDYTSNKQIIGDHDTGDYWLYTDIQETREEEKGDYQLSLDIVGYEEDLDSLSLNIEGGRLNVYHDDLLIAEEELGEEYNGAVLNSQDDLKYNNGVITAILEDINSK